MSPNEPDELTERCLRILKEAEVPEKTLWLVEVETLESFAAGFPEVAGQILPDAEELEYDFILYHHQSKKITDYETFSSNDSMDVRRACNGLAERLKRQPSQNRYIVECEHCGATGQDGEEECPACEGTGYLPTSEGLEILDALEALKPWWRGHQ